jgi:hypothetical protein
MKPSVFPPFIVILKPGDNRPPTEASMVAWHVAYWHIASGIAVQRHVRS